ncbi:MAG: ISNCY family transposase [Chloroflexi bacterium]|nr:ISNCY family transposase [Chloroflexota bacterium]
MTAKEQVRVQVLAGMLDGRYAAEEAAALLARSPRQVRRLRAAFLRDGPKALAHGNRGRRPAHALNPGIAARVLALASGVYAGCNDQHLSELLAEHDGILLHRSSVRRILRGAGRQSPQRRRPPKHRARRERMPQAGMLLQVDGSRHRWLGPDGPWLTLIAGIDDATGDVPWAVFREQEDAAGYLLLLQQVVRRRGVPLALYSDRHTIFQVRADDPLSPEELLAGGRPRTQVGRVLADLDITWIGARSPQAKGRIERLWRTLQNRWVAELRLRGVTTIAEANRALPALLAQHNTRFRQRAATAGPAYRKPPYGAARDVFCFKYWRTVGNDNVVTVDGRAIAIPPGPQRRSYAKARVEIREHLDASASVYYDGACIARQRPQPGPLRTKRRGHIGERPAPEPPPTLPATRRAAVSWTPPTTHPWRRDTQTTENGRQRYAAARLPLYNADSIAGATVQRTKSRNT